MKVLYYSTAYYASHGGSSQSLLFFKELQRHPQVTEAVVFPAKAPAIPDMKKSKGGPLRKWLRSIPVLQILFLYRRNQFYLSGLEQEINTKRPDVIIIQLDSTFLQVGYLKKKFPSLTVAAQINASPFDEPFKNIAFKSYFRSIERSSLAKADANLFVSAILREKIMGKATDRKRDFVIHNGVETDVFIPIADKVALRAKYGFSPGTFIIGYIGTLDYHKKVDLLIRSFEELKKKHAQAVLVIVGDGPSMTELKILAEKLSMATDIRFTGWVSHHEIPGYLNCFDVAIHHYAMDYMSPLKIFEYMSVGLPVIGPDIPAVREVFTHGKDLLLTTGTKHDIVEKIEQFMNDRNFARVISENGQQLIRAKYTWAHHVDQVIQSLQTALSS